MSNAKYRTSGRDREVRRPLNLYDDKWLKAVRAADPAVDEFCKQIDRKIDALTFPFIVTSAGLEASPYIMPMIKTIVSVHLAQYKSEKMEYLATAFEATSTRPFIVWKIDFRQLEPNRRADVVYEKVQLLLSKSKADADARSNARAHWSTQPDQRAQATKPGKAMLHPVQQTPEPTPSKDYKVVLKYEWEQLPTEKPGESIWATKTTKGGKSYSGKHTSNVAEF
jgi:hypothetical protein